jgi:hypothetical protein
VNTGLAMPERALRYHDEADVERHNRLIAEGRCISRMHDGAPVPAEVSGIFDLHDQTSAGPIPAIYCRSCARLVKAAGMFTPLDGA